MPISSSMPHWGGGRSHCVFVSCFVGSIIVALLVALLPTASVAQEQRAVNTKPDFVRGPIVANTYDGTADDLLTAGLGADGIADPTPPAFADPTNPTAAELRRWAIYTNYRALVDTSAGGGYGTFYGPSVGASGDGKVAGKEYLAYADDGTGEQNVALMVQIPATFDPANACIVTGPSSGSRGIHGAIGTAGEWGLKRGCAVAYTDKGTGNGFHNLDTNTVTLIQGNLADATLAGDASHFTAAITPSFTISNPNRLAFKHAHSQQNPEQDWGTNVLQSIKFAFYVLNLAENYGQVQGSGVMQTVTPDTTIVIASSVSNGGGASLRAAEQDTEGLIDGVAVSEPNVNPTVDKRLVIEQGDQTWRFPNHSRALYDYYTLLDVYQPCANLAPGIKDVAPFNTTSPFGPGFFVREELGANRCAALEAAGLLAAGTVAEQATRAQAIINASGILENQNYLQPSHHTFSIIESIAMTYANAYGRFSVADNLCNFSFAGIGADLSPAPLTTAQLAALFAVGNGIPPTGGVQIVNNASQGGPLLTRESVSPAGLQDQNLDGALCLRQLATGVDASGAPLSGVEREQYQRVQRGIAEIRASGDLQGKPAIIVHGRSDAILPPNHTSRPYFGLNQVVEGAASNLHYYEILNAQHLDAFNAFPGFSSRYIPLHYYYNQALDLMYDHLRNGTPLPASQVVTTVPRGAENDGTVPPLSEDNLPPIAANPAVDQQVTFSTPGTGAIAIYQGPAQLFLPLVQAGD